METKELLPISHLNTYVYCPRRFYLIHNQGMFEDNEHTLEGRQSHYIVDAREKEGKEEKKNECIHHRSVQFSSSKLGIIGKLDLVEEKENITYPVEYKKGKKPPKGKDPWLNDQVQLCAQALLINENGLAMPEKAYLYYIGSKARVEVPLSQELIQKTYTTISECHRISQENTLPPLLQKRNQCYGCSLNAICLPEEEEILKGNKTNAKNILPSSLDGDVLYVDRVGAYLSLSENTAQVYFEGEKLTEIALEKIREIVLYGPIQMTTQLLQQCMEKSIAVHYLNTYGKYVGTALPMIHHHGILREAQWKAHFCSDTSLQLAKTTVISKIANLRTLFMRYLREERIHSDILHSDQIKELQKKAEQSQDIESLRGYEGLATQIYFAEFERYIKPEQRKFFYFNNRNRRPPKDPVNALLSYGYSLLAKDCSCAATRVGFDPYCGFYHTMKYGRPSLSLDVMEYFRQPIVDSAVITAINNEVFKENDFHQYQGVCYLNEKGRKKFLIHYQMRKKDFITHPKFHYRLSYERTIELQFRIIAKFLLKEIPTCEGFYIR
ncbi:MAG: CRISPR-associated endonuclease Cas1 [Candidatus Brocadiae bacterium]|nr:CRISPR-associated endonuclease Cas1 [Candidatus Brocadiia bacterium]